MNETLYVILFVLQLQYYNTKDVDVCLIYMPFAIPQAFTPNHRILPASQQ